MTRTQCQEMPVSPKVQPDFLEKRRDIDLSLIEAQLRRSVPERMAVHDRALTLALALRQAVRERHD